MKAARASSTAKVIAAATILLDVECGEAGAVAPGAAELCQDFLSTCAADRLLAASAACRAGRWFWRAVERLTLPGIIRHYWIRKSWIERLCREAIAMGVENIVILGAGFDTLGIRLAREFREVRFLEIDHPATQAVKQSAITRRLKLPRNLHFAAADLAAEPLPLVHFQAASTLVIMEGLLMYLREDTICSMFDALRNAPCRDVRVIFSFMEKWPDHTSGFRPRSPCIDGWLAWRGEPFTWAIEPDRLPGFLRSLGFELTDLAVPPSPSVPQDRALRGECFALTLRSDAGKTG